MIGIAIKYISTSIKVLLTAISNSVDALQPDEANVRHFKRGLRDARAIIARIQKTITISIGTIKAATAAPLAYIRAVRKDLAFQDRAREVFASWRPAKKYTYVQTWEWHPSDDPFIVGYRLISRILTPPCDCGETYVEQAGDCIKCGSYRFSEIPGEVESALTAYDIHLADAGDMTDKLFGTPTIKHHETKK